MNPPVALCYRPALAGEAAGMAALSRELIETGLGWRYTPARITALIQDCDTIALAACSSAGLHGFAVMQFADTTAHLTLLCVQPAWQRRGIATRLLGWLLESAQVAGIASIGLELRADNAAAHAFYRGLAFGDGQRVADYYGAGIDAQRMVRRLRPAPDAAAPD